MTTENFLNMLHPHVKLMAQKLIEMCQGQGIKIIITQTYRSIAEQNKLYAQGRTTPGKIVTNAKGGESYHNYRLAFDFVPVVKGHADWKDLNKFKQIGLIAKSIGLEWGGDWKFKDYPHCQYTFGLSIKDLKAGKTPEGGK